MSSLWPQSLLPAMRRALALAERGRPGAAPNPMVGAVLVREGRLLAEGWHERAGDPHAEVRCLRGLPRSVTRGADLVVTLEPCCHEGRTPPCTGLILAAGISRLVAAMEDPNPLVAGQGLAQLRAGGVETTCGLLEGEARALNRHFVSAMTRGRPWVTLKWAQSLDGLITRQAGRPTALSGPASREETRLLRAAHPGLLIGVGTALADDPLLGLPHIPGRPFSGRAPHRLVLDSRARLPLDGRLVRSAREQPLTLLCGREAPTVRVRRLERLGVGVARHGGAARPPLDWVLAECLALGLDGLLVEGGAAVHGSFLAAGLVDELVTITAPLLLGRGLPAVQIAEGVAPARAFRLVRQRRVGADLWQAWRPEARG
ncbi:MAG: bifunctional diaminohydroxyphosphoribosylaminopyrimidine deaminase/5-amino-6-(5-phosphoribosylamino)uracil reductase RibD [bacterium]|nr:bifunctional diaminohydroxyphosphoribosylaminopyrimidine deaminase/5-amino-6-(5-phosphoribosylamino)uracil reductase RibD [bacterium]